MTIISTRVRVLTALCIASAAGIGLSALPAGAFDTNTEVYFKTDATGSLDDVIQAQVWGIVPDPDDVKVCADVDPDKTPVDTSTCKTITVKTCPLVAINDTSADVCVPVDID